MEDRKFVELCRRFCDDELTLRQELLARGVTVLEGRSPSDLLNPLTTTFAARTKPGPKPKAKIEAAESPKPKGKPGPKPKAKPEVGEPSPALVGRRAVANGERPPISEAMAIVMGKKTMGAEAILAGLIEKGWGPNAKEPRAYVSIVLAQQKQAFARVKHGHYRVKADWLKARTKKNEAAKAVLKPVPKRPASVKASAASAALH